MTTDHIEARPGWDAWALGIAHAIGPGPTGRADCTRRKVGAVIIEPRRHRIIGAGYNGAEPGGPSCLAGECPRGRHYRQKDPYAQTCDWIQEHGIGREDGGWICCSQCVFRFKCACGKEWHAESGCEDAVAPGSSYDTGPGVCIASHAEQNALADVDSRERLTGATIYVTEEPCGGCLRQIKNTTEIARAVWPTGEWRRGGEVASGTPQAFLSTKPPSEFVS